ncbi:hypothetical protein [Persicobacter psychrovividus]|uniref:Uncharacterized protein n=1 Tax=Persicobacter psychrovividus TaxID=387638 RepID=A0ABN6L5B5_9BACT|nr:hypothetical protein PEPS_05920 [Persicobacter psychrovividus]
MTAHFNRNIYQPLFFLLLISLIPSKLMAQANQHMTVEDIKGKRIYPIIYNHYKDIIPAYDQVEGYRRTSLKQMAQYFRTKQANNLPARFLFYTDQDPQLTQLALAWATVAAHYFKIKQVSFYAASETGGSIDHETIKVLEKMGFIAYKDEYGRPIYQLHYGYQQAPLKITSLRPNEKGVPHQDFCTVILDNSSPYLKGADRVIHLPYEDRQVENLTLANQRISTEMFLLFKHLRD